MTYKIEFQQSQQINKSTYVNENIDIRQFGIHQNKMININETSIGSNIPKDGGLKLRRECTDTITPVRKSFKRLELQLCKSMCQFKNY